MEKKSLKNSEILGEKNVKLSQMSIQQSKYRSDSSLEYSNDSILPDQILKESVFENPKECDAEELFRNDPILRKLEITKKLLETQIELIIKNYCYNLSLIS